MIISMDKRVADTYRPIPQTHGPPTKMKSKNFQLNPNAWNAKKFFVLLLLEVAEGREDRAPVQESQVARFVC